MVVLANPPLNQIPLVLSPELRAQFAGVPVVDLSSPVEAAEAIVKACQDFGFFKVVNHGIPMELAQRLEAEAVKFFLLPQADKEKSGLANPYGYGNRRIGLNGDMGWLEYLIFAVTSKASSLAPIIEHSALSEYLTAVRKLASDVLDLMARGLKIEAGDALSKLVMDEESDGIFRMNHYPPCPQPEGFDCCLTGFGEHTDPQIVSVLRSNNSTGFQISLKDGSWVAVPPDDQSFFINVGDSLQVLTNGRFKSVRHRVLANGLESRVSMIYFLGPAPGAKIAPLRQLMQEGAQSKYREFTWGEYKKAAHGTRLADDRLSHFQK